MTIMMAEYGNESEMDIKRPMPQEGQVEMKDGSERSSRLKLSLDDGRLRIRRTIQSGTRDDVILVSCELSEARIWFSRDGNQVRVNNGGRIYKLSFPTRWKYWLEGFRRHIEFSEMRRRLERTERSVTESSTESMPHHRPLRDKLPVEGPEDITPASCRGELEKSVKRHRKQQEKDRKHRRERTHYDHLPLAIGVYEPLSLLQTVGSTMLEHVKLLDYCAKQTKPVERITRVAAFVFCNTRDHNRLWRATQSQLGESYELDRTAEFGWRYHAERVDRDSIAMCVESKRWCLWAQAAVNETQPEKNVFRYEMNDRFELRMDGGEVYEWHSFDLLVHLPSPNERYFSHVGEVTVDCNNGLRAQISVEPAHNAADRCRLQGRVLVEAVEECRLIGSCSAQSRSVYQEQGNAVRCLYFDPCPAPDYLKYFGFSKMVLSMNQILDQDVDRLPPTDSRFRPDTMLIESGKFKDGKRIRKHLAKKEQEQHQNHQPLWFTKNREEIWKCNHTYWIQRKNEFKGVKFPNIW